MYVVVISIIFRLRFKIYEFIIIYFEFLYKFNYLFLICNDLGFFGRLLFGEFKDFNYKFVGLLVLLFWILLGF